MPKPKIFTGSSLFGDLTLQVQARIDAASALNKRLFDTVVYRQFLDWDDPMIGLDFEEMIGKYNISIVAATIGENSESPIIGTEGIETLKNRVLNHSLTVPLTMTDYRKVLQLRFVRTLSPMRRLSSSLSTSCGVIPRPPLMVSRRR